MIDQIKDAVLEAQADVQGIMREVMREMIAPHIQRMAKMKWAHMSADEKELFKRQQPEQYQALMKELKGGTYATK